MTRQIIFSPARYSVASAVLILLLLATRPESSDADSDNDDGIPVVNRWPSGAVHELTETSLTEVIYRFESVLVDFYTSWCKHCKALAPELDLAAPVLASHYPPVVVGKINIEKYPKVAAKYKIEKFPTLTLFLQGTPTPYTGPRSAHLMVPFIKRQLAPDVEVLESEAEVKEFLTTHRGQGLGLFLGFGVDAQMVQPLASRYKAHSWFAVHLSVTEGLMYTYDFDKGPALLAIHEDGEQEVFYGPFDDGKDLEEFVRLNLFPPVMLLDEDTFPRITRSGRAIVLIAANFDSQAPKSLAMDAPDPNKVDSPAGDAVRYTRRCKPVARRHRKYLFAYVDASKHPSFLAPFGINASTPLPAIVVWNGGLQYYAYDKPEEFRGEDMEFALSHFLQDIDAKKIVARKTMDPSLTEKAWHVVNNPNFPFVIALIFIAICMKLGKKGQNVFLPKLDFVAKKRQLEQEEKEKQMREQELRENGGSGNGDTEDGGEGVARGKEQSEGDSAQEPGTDSKKKLKEEKKND